MLLCYPCNTGVAQGDGSLVLPLCASPPVLPRLRFLTQGDGSLSCTPPCALIQRDMDVLTQATSYFSNEIQRRIVRAAFKTGDIRFLCTDPQRQFFLRNIKLTSGVDDLRDQLIARFQFFIFHLCNCCSSSPNNSYIFKNSFKSSHNLCCSRVLTPKPSVYTRSSMSHFSGERLFSQLTAFSFLTSRTKRSAHRAPAR